MTSLKRMICTDIKLSFLNGHKSLCVNECMLSAIVPRIALGGACQANDVCENVNAVCDGGRCTCKQGYIQESDTCGKFSACELPLLDECSDKW